MRRPRKFVRMRGVGSLGSARKVGACSHSAVRRGFSRSEGWSPALRWNAASLARSSSCSAVKVGKWGGAPGRCVALRHSLARIDRDATLIAVL